MTLILSRLVLAGWLVGSGVAAAQSTAPDPAAQTARELLAVTVGASRTELLFNQLLGPLVESGRAGLQQALNRPPSDADMAAYRGALERAFNSVFTAAVLAETLVPTVVSSFSVGEMSELITFLRTPLGQKLLAFQERSMEQAAATGQELMERKKVELTQALEREFKAAFPEFVKRGR